MDSDEPSLNQSVDSFPTPKFIKANKKNENKAAKILANGVLSKRRLINANQNSLMLVSQKSSGLSKKERIEQFKKQKTSSLE